MIGALDKVYRDTALPAGKFSNIVDIVELADSGHGALRLDARRLEQKDGQTSRRDLLPARQQCGIRVAGKRIPAQSQAKLAGAIVTMTQKGAHPAASRPIAQLLPHLGSF